MLVLSNNLLRGPAFPATWMMPGSLPAMMLLDLSGNRDLTGTLPADMSFWPSLTDLVVKNTSLHGTVPREWCTLGFGAPSVKQV